MVAKIRKARRYAIDGFYAIVATITILLLPCGPHNVRWEVADGIIEPFNRPSFFADSNICNKSFENHPFWANCNPTSAIVVEIIAVWIRTSGFHGFPNAMDARSTHTVGAKRPTCRAGDEATARSRPTTPQAGADYGFGNAAIASANISSHFAAVGRYVGGCFRNYNQPSKSEADHVYCVRHNGGSSLFMFSGGRHGYNRALAMIL